jgi:hypothetical protein
VNPKELDTPTKHHAVPDPESPSDSAAVTGASGPVDPMYQGDEFSDPSAPATRGGAQ